MTNTIFDNTTNILPKEITKVSYETKTGQKITANFKKPITWPTFFAFSVNLKRKYGYQNFIILKSNDESQLPYSHLF